MFWIRFASILLNIICNYILQGYLEGPYLTFQKRSSKLAIFKSYSTLFKYGCWTKLTISLRQIQAMLILCESELYLLNQTFLYLVWFRAIKFCFLFHFWASQISLSSPVSLPLILSVLQVFFLISAESLRTRLNICIH